MPSRSFKIASQRIVRWASHPVYLGCPPDTLSAMSEGESAESVVASTGLRDGVVDLLGVRSNGNLML